MPEQQANSGISTHDIHEAFRFSAQHARVGIQTHPLATLAIVLAPGFSQRFPIFCRAIFILSVLTAIFRWFGVRIVQARADINRRDWLTLIAVPMVFANLLWALQASVMLWVGPLDTAVMLVLLGSVALAFGCVVSYAPHRALALTMLVIHLGLPLISTLAHREDLWMLLALLLIAFMLYVVRIATSLHRDYWSAVAMRHHLTEARERAEAANRAKDQFLANISHEIRTPLNGIAAPAELLRHTAMGNEQQQLLKLITSSAYTLTQLIDDLLDFSKIEVGKLMLLTQPFSVRTLLHDVVERHRLSAEVKGLALVLNEAMPAHNWLLGDALRIGQIVDNLLSNAIKFTEHGSVGVDVSLENAHRIAQLTITVSDSGVGIADALRDKIFQPFVQGDTSTTRRFSGTCLGLSISKRLAEQMHGTLQFVSKINTGTRFTLVVTLPQAEPQALPEHKALPVRFSGIRVLVAEDNRVNQQVIRHQLQSLGISPDIVDDGQHALTALAHNSYDLIFLDCQMPVLDGYETAQHLRSDGGINKTVPIIALTAHAMASDEQRAIAAGMNAYLSKPVSLQVLAQTITQWLGEKDIDNNET
ncbi:MAG: hypothetical protein JWM78_3766 [Verrucomicrobiaceae bacterium]|nr:hypothetical protein [Verrucomicrobiaceae bacterium]